MRGEYREGDLLPSEREFKARYNISSTTIRYPLSDLVHENLLERKVGKGTFVCVSESRKGRRGILGFDGNMRRMGLIPSTRVLCKELIPASGCEGEKLGLGKEKKLVKLERLRLGNVDPIMLERRFIRTDLCPAIHKRGLSSFLWQVYKEQYGVRPSRQSQHIRIERIFGNAASLLGVGEGVPCFLIEGVTYLEDSQTIEWGEFLCRSDKHDLAFEAAVE